MKSMYSLRMSANRSYKIRMSNRLQKDYLEMSYLRLAFLITLKF